MRHLIVFFLLAGCVHAPTMEMDEINECIQMQIEAYGDLCAEARPCQGGPDEVEQYCTDAEADKRGSATLLIENHFLGVVCASENIKQCIHGGE